jgi:hypothetical protein
MNKSVVLFLIPFQYPIPGPQGIIEFEKRSLIHILYSGVFRPCLAGKERVYPNQFHNSSGAKQALNEKLFQENLKYLTID